MCILLFSDGMLSLLSLYISIKSILSNVLFKAFVTLIFCLDDPFIDISVVLKFPTIVVILDFTFYVC